MTISYHIHPVSPESHYFRIRLRIPEPDAAGQRLALPAWIPGSYMIRDFARHIVRIEARSNGAPISLRKLDKLQWLAEPCSGELEVEYDVYAWDLSVRGAHLDLTHGFFNGTSVFLRVGGQELQPVEVIIDPPAATVGDDWRLATTLPVVTTDERGFGQFRVADYATLIDHPVEMGSFDTLSFELDGVEHVMAITGRHSADKARIAKDLEQICCTHLDLFGAPLPMDRYLFLTTVVGDGYGGLEHRDSTALLCKRDDLPRPGLGEPDAGYRRFLGLCSHEYFHLWNVKRIQPQCFKEADLLAEVHTGLLWAFEGITSYYDELALVRAGRITPEAYLSMLAETVTRVMRGGGRMRQSVAESSFDAWTKFYKQDENAANAIVSYYAKGALVALGLDLTLRLQTGDRLSLDNLMKALWKGFGIPAIGVGEHDVENLAIELGGESLRPFFETAVHGTAELPLADWFTKLGIGMRLRPARDSKDLGGGRTPLGSEDDVPLRADIGVRIEPAANGVRVVQVRETGAAAAAGIAAGDVLLACNGIKMTAADFDTGTGRLCVGEPVTVHLFRRDELMQVSVTPQPSPLDTCELWLLDERDLDAARLQRRQQWLGMGD